MAESTGEPSPNDAALSKRIQDYFNSPEGRQNFYEGFVSRSDAIKLNEIAERESRRYQFPSDEGGVHQGGPSGETVKNAVQIAIQRKQCQDLGHAWQADSEAFALICVRCGLRKLGPRGLPLPKWPAPGTNPNWGAEDPFGPEELDEPEEADPHLMCLWCGMVCDDLEALDLHEEECEP